MVPISQQNICAEEAYFAISKHRNTEREWNTQ